MEQLNAVQIRVLSDAVDKRRRNDTLETAVGREVRRAGLQYQDYMGIVEAVRAIARKEKLDPWKAVQVLLDQK